MVPLEPLIEVPDNRIKNGRKYFGGTGKDDDRPQVVLDVAGIYPMIILTGIILIIKLSLAIGAIIFLETVLVPTCLIVLINHTSSLTLHPISGGCFAHMKNVTPTVYRVIPIRRYGSRRRIVCAIELLGKTVHQSEYHVPIAVKGYIRQDGLRTNSLRTIRFRICHHRIFAKSIAKLCPVAIPLIPVSLFAFIGLAPQTACGVKNIIL